MFYYAKCQGKKNSGFFIRETTPKKNGHFYSKFSSNFSSELSSSVARDLVRIGQGIFLCDRAFTRSKSLGTKTRQLSVTIPVENIDLFKKIEYLYEKWTYFVTHDSWDIRFTKNKSRLINKGGHGKIPFKNDNSVVTLFSDGLDSLCGASYIFQKNEHAVFVSHCPPGLKTVSSTLTKLEKCLEKHGKGNQIANFYFITSDKDPESGKRKMFQERSRRTRPILFLSMAGSLALELKIKTIRINENGIMSINLPITGFKKGVDISRHAHPETLRLYEDILNELTSSENKIKIINPFNFLTKAQELRYITNADELIRETKSCEYGRQQIALLKNIRKNTRQDNSSLKECGLCIPCLIRRIALSENNIVENYNHYAYSHSLDTSELYKKKDKKAPLLNIINDNPYFLLEFCRRIENMAINSFVINYIYELSLLYRDQKQLCIHLPEIYNMHKAFAKEALTFLTKSEIKK
jgi:7-cyano-7-deazaguanine synthase in queuosine biosynthesis